jgi:hypothetical protein
MKKTKREIKSCSPRGTAEASKDEKVIVALGFTAIGLECEDGVTDREKGEEEKEGGVPMLLEGEVERTDIIWRGELGGLE